MKKNFIILLGIGLGIIFLTSCKDYLDKSPEAGLTEEEVFSKYENFKSFFDYIYGDPKQVAANVNTSFYTGAAEDIRNTFTLYNPCFRGNKLTWEAWTDLSDQGNLSISQQIKSGTNPTRAWKEVNSLLFAIFKCIRVSNMTIKNLPMLKDGAQADIDDLKAQAHFIRAYCHFEFVRLYGGLSLHIPSPRTRG